MIRFHERRFKTILNVRKWIDAWFWDRYAVNPYNGCSFACLYCDARSAKYHMPEDFENQITVKLEAASMLDERLRRARSLLPDVVATGGATDPYQPAEARYRNTRALLEILLKHGYPAHVITKSKSVLADADLLQALAEKTWCTVSLSFSSPDETTARLLDRRAPSPQKRLETIRALKTRAPAVQCGALFMPITPVLADSPEQIDAMVDGAADAGADYLVFATMTMRDVHALWFLDNIHAARPELIPAFEELYRFSYKKDNPREYQGAFTPRADYIARIHARVLKACARRKLPYRIPRYIPGDYRSLNYRVAERLLNHAYELQLRSLPYLNHFWAAQNIQNLKFSLARAADKKELRNIRNVQGTVGDLVEELTARLREEAAHREGPQADLFGSL